MTAAILAQNEAPSAASARVTFSLPSVRVLTLAASFACHTGLALFAYAHTNHALAPPVPEASRTPVEISIVTVEPGLVLEPPAANEVSAATRAASTPHSARIASTPVSNAQPTTAAAAALAPAAPLERAEPAAPRFIVQAPVVVAGMGAPSAALGQPSEHVAAEELPFAEGQVDSPAKLQAGTPPTYTAAAEAAGVEAELALEVVIDRSGAVQSARTLQHVGYGLDEAAVGAVRRYRFSPARRAGTAVPVRMRWVVSFQLR